MPSDALTLRYLFDLYARHKLPMAAEHTRYRYTYALSLYRDYLEREPMLTDLEDTSVSACVGWIIRTRRLSAATASKFRDCILAAWRFGARKGIVSHWPDVPDVVVPRRIPVAWTRQELAKLWDYLRRMPGELAGIPASLWFCSLHACLFDSGERIGALLRTEWSQVDLRDGWLVVKAETRKGGLSDKLSKLHPRTCELLEQIVYPERKLVWPWPFAKHYLWVQYGQILRRAGLPSGRERKFHCMRRACATHLTALAGEGAAQEALGHNDARMTRDHYVDSRQVPKKYPSDILFRPDSPDPPRAA